MANQNGNIEYVAQNGFSLHPEFHDFMETAVIAGSDISSAEFWQVFTNTLSVAKNKTSTLSCGHQIDVAPVAVPIGDTSLNFNAINTRWGSLYETLYSENVIPHCAGLKPGNGRNQARRDRVINCTKDFLDSTFPLREGSHRDATSYMVYCQNLLIILADGTTTGLQNPEQFTGKNGPTNDPESILLSHSGMHAEIIFDRNGTAGKHDLANIDDIQLEAANHTQLDLSASSVTEKCSTYQQWLQLVEAGLHDKSFTGNDGSALDLNHNNWAIKLSDQSDHCDLVYDQQGEPVAIATVDALTAALIYAHSHKGCAHLSIYVTDNNAGVDEELFTQMGKLLAMSQPGARVKGNCIKVLPAAADNVTQARTMSPTECVPGPDSVVISAMTSHGYDVTQAVNS